jgi:hypothetical protein
MTPLDHLPSRLDVAIGGAWLVVLWLTLLATPA